MKSKKGMDAIVTTVIMVALALIAIGIIWAVISALIANRSGDINVQSQCLSTGLEITSASCLAGNNTWNGSCSVVVKRKTGNDDISGVRLSVSTNAEDKDSNIALGASSPTLSFNTSLNAPKYSGETLSAVAYYKVSGVKSYCPQAATYKLP